ncbi:histone acetyltransferase 1 [Orbilia brochopaga]|uniref:Histone acetyltransferase type B catalytic subunit n=1 Tax=Orbilia brochopaga TaxID=3140254 RepID=A0AAV9UJZ6_9PEZI
MEEWATLQANDAITISLVPPQSFPPGSSARTFHPAMTYQLFEGESIYGYKNLTVDIKFRQDDMSPSLSVKYDEKLSAAGSSTDTANEARVDEVEPILRALLPEDTPSKLDLSDTNFAPPGEQVNSYFHKGTKYQIYRANLSDPKARDLVHRTQILVLFFIEAGSIIDISEAWLQKRWDVFLLYETLPNDKLSFVGLCTIHKPWYFSPEAEKASATHTNGETDGSIDKSTQFVDTIKQGTSFSRSYRARISQFIILPPYQRQGHAKELYNSIITTYLPDSDVKEITVEDPSDRFEDLRDIADYYRLKKAGLVTPDIIETLLQRDAKARLWVDTQRQVVKMPRRQFMRIVEMLMYEIILCHDEEEERKEQLAKFAIYVKDRLYRHNKDILMQLERNERSDKLNETYDNVRDDYGRLLRKIGSPAADRVPELATSDQKDQKVISGKRSQRDISTIEEEEDEEDEDEDVEELQPPSKKKRTV